jgi:hypothetical protein
MGIGTAPAAFGFAGAARLAAAQAAHAAPSISSRQQQGCCRDMTLLLPGQPLFMSGQNATILPKSNTFVIEEWLLFMLLRGRSRRVSCTRL